VLGGSREREQNVAGTDVRATGDEGLADAIESDSREDAARAIAPVIVGMLERRTGSRAEALAALPAAVKAVISARRRLKKSALRSGILGILKEKAPGSPVNGIRKGLSRAPDGAAVVAAALAGDAEGLEELILVAVEDLSFREAGPLTDSPAAMIEKQASLAFTRIAEALAGQ
jgi:hypothetical protein